MPEQDLAEHDACHRCPHSKAPPRGRQSDTVPFLPTHILPFLPAYIHKQKALTATARNTEPSKHSIWMWL